MAKSALRRFLRCLPLAALGLALATPQAQAASSSPTAPSSAPASAASVDRPFLWRIDGGAAPSYLFGTIHAGVQASELHPIVDSALHQSRLFVMETAPQGALQASAPPSAVLPMDLVLARHAHEIGKPVATLETVEFQLSLLNELAGADAREEFSAMLAEDPQAMASLVAAYRSGSIEQIAEVSQAQDARTQELLLDTRNRRWVEDLEPLMRRGGVFAAVGVGHAPGPQGLLELFGQRGYRLQQYAVRQSAAS